ncbi:hypothetical protein [Leptospira idonii]|uniref:Uncharacterized protein n=1 Tax=Leptospira idonii TaxID=1193500 RepID=A0A4R9LZE3_9LEPT|nr:hypothetical protein [Leptospira idonii]TGN19794.1 hypothetical protein EHS15_07035 [Leptospira idonii]
MSPVEAELYLNGYIEETVLLQQARQEVDFKSKDFKEFITPYLTKGVIDYYFFEKTGGVKDYRNFDYDSDIVNEMKAKGILKEKISKEEEKMLAELVVWRRLELNSKKRQEDIKLMIAKLKIQNKVTVFPVNK